MAGEISNYTTEATEVNGNEDWMDISVLISTAPDVYDTQRVRTKTVQEGRFPFGIARRYKGQGNTDLDTDEAGDWRQRVDASGDFVHEVYNGTIWVNKSKFLKGF